MVSYMSDHVSKNDEDYWKNMKRGSVWVNIMIEYNGVIRTRNFSEVFTWVDVSYAVNNHMRRHTGEVISMGYGIIHGKPLKQNINVKN